MVAHLAHHRIYGGCLETQLEIPFLRHAAPSDPDWVVRVTEDRDPLVDPVRLGEEPLVDTVWARLDRSSDRYRLIFDDTGTFDVSRDGHEIAWTPRPGADRNLALTDLLGRVLSLAIHAAGDLCLHASAVEVDECAVAFLAPKGFGKSALAMATVSAGARLLTDDTLRLRLGDPLLAAPGLSSVRLWSDVADHLGRRAAMVLETDGGKLFAPTLPAAELATEPTPLSALYILAPVRTAGGQTIQRRLLSSVEATIGIVQHAKIALLLGKDEGAAVLTRAASVAARTPVYRLEVQRDLGRLPEAARQVMAWHRAAATSSAMYPAAVR